MTFPSFFSVATNLLMRLVGSLMALPTMGPFTRLRTEPNIMVEERSHSQALSRAGLPNCTKKPPGTSAVESSSCAARAPGGRPGRRVNEPVARWMVS